MTGFPLPAFPLPEFLAGFGLSVLAVVVLLAVVFAVAVAQKRHSVIDTAWGSASWWLPR